MNFLYKESKSKKIFFFFFFFFFFCSFFWGGGWGGGGMGTRASKPFYKESKSRIFFEGGGQGVLGRGLE